MSQAIEQKMCDKKINVATFENILKLNERNIAIIS